MAAPSSPVKYTSPTGAGAVFLREANVQEISLSMNVPNRNRLIDIPFRPLIRDNANFSQRWPNNIHEHITRPNDGNRL